MIITKTHLSGLFIVDVDKRVDQRGYFCRTYCREEFATAGLATEFVQCNLSHNLRTGTLRGMHYQKEPYPEAKLVRCTRGAILDVVVDLRADSATHEQSLAIELTQQNARSLYIPAGFAHGFLTLADDTDVFYQMTEFYHAELSCGVRWNDPAFAINWPIAEPFLSDRDATYPSYTSSR